jgi:hypothetical protein
MFFDIHCGPRPAIYMSLSKKSHGSVAAKSWLCAIGPDVTLAGNARTGNRFLHTPDPDLPWITLNN